MLYRTLRHCFRLGCILCAGVLLSPSWAAADTARLNTGDLVVRVAGVETGRGAVHYALYDSAKYFPTRTGRVVKGEVPVSSAGATIVIKGLRPGTYALAVFHDENLNEQFDQGVFGIPLENYGFSNNARGFFSAPDFNDAKFQVRGGKTEIFIELGK